MTRSLGMAHLKSHLSEIVGEVQHRKTRIVIERNGKPVAMLVPVSSERPQGLLGFVGAFDDVPVLGSGIGL